MVFGATGYTGRQTVIELQRRGLPLAIGGRDRERLTGLKTSLKLAEDVPVVTADPTQPASLPRLFENGVEAIINCVGPFTRFGEPVVGAAITAGVHYLDITGEQAYLARILTRYDEPARRKEVAVVPACGFEFAITNWAAALAAEGLEPLTDLWTATTANNIRASRGTQLSLFEALAQPGLGWHNGQRRIKLTASAAREVDFGPPFGRRRAVWGPLGELITIPRHIQVQNMNSYLTLPTPLALTVQALSPVLPPLSQMLGGLLKPMMRGPQADHEENSRWAVVAEAVSPQGRRRTRLEGRNVYYLTSIITAWCAAKMLEPAFKAVGTLGPAQAFDPHEALDYLRDFGLSYEG